MMIQAAVIQIDCPYHGTHIIADEDLRVNETGRKFIDLDTGTKQ